MNPSSLPEPVEEDPEHEWYANLLWFDRRKCLLLTHAATLFPIFVGDVRKSDLVPLGSLAVTLIEDALHSEDLPATTFGALSVADVRMAKTASRTVLGCMNDQALMIERHLMSFPDLATADLALVNYRLRRTINSPNGARYPIDLAAERALRIRGISASN